MRIRPVLLSLLASIALVCTPAYAFETAPEVEEAQAAIVVDSSGSILWSKNVEREMGMASVTKVMTAVVALDSGMDLDTVCSIDYVDLGPYSQTAGFTSDDAPTLRDLLRVMLVYSGNDAACYVAQNVAGSVDEFVVLMNAKARELGITMPILGTDGWDDPKVKDIAGADAINNTFFCTHYSDKDAEVKPFLDAFNKKFGHAPNVFAALGYDAGKVLIDALKRAGSDDSEKLAKAIAETKNLKAGTGTISMDANHNPIKQAVILENKNGGREVVAKIVP